jgi:FAD/FMN-containing dehydrogenase
VVALEGTHTEVEWMIGQLAAQWGREGIAAPDVVRDQAAAPHWQRLVEFALAPGHSNGDPTLTVKICVQPSAILNTIRELFWLQPGVSLQSHAGNGVIWARLPLAQPQEWRELLDGRLRGPVAAVGGSLTVVSYPAGLDLSARDVWGPPGGAAPLMRIIKQQLDPQGLLNPGRFFLENS